MKVAIHQPNYMPWLGYFLKIYLADTFVFHDDVLFSKSSYTKRTKVRKELKSGETQWLGLSIKNSNEKIVNIDVCDQETTIEAHLRKIYYIYHKAKYYDEYIESIKSILETSKSISKLGLLNASLVIGMCKILDIDTPVTYSSKIEVEGKGNEYNLNLCQHLGATEYVSGMGANNYQDSSSFEKRNIYITKVDMFNYLEENPYSQTQGEFLNGLSILDALFNVGAKGIKEIFSSFEEDMK